MVSPKVVRVLCLTLLVLCFYSVSNAQRRHDRDDRERYHWEYLGKSHVDGRVDHDSIDVGGGRGSFRAIQIRVKGGAIEFNRVVVHFENGSDFPVEIRSRIPDGGVTRAIDLPGDRRDIRSVEFWYAKANWRTRPWVNLWGAH